MGTSKVAVPNLAVPSQLGDAGSARDDKGGLKESNENDNPGQNFTPETKATKPRRVSESGIPRTTPRRVSSGTGQEKIATPRGTPRITPRETRSSTLRKSVSGVDSSLLQSGSIGSQSAASQELTRLRDDLHAKQKEADRLGDEVATLKGSVAAKERALTKLSADNESLNTRLLQAEGSLASKVKEQRALEAERNKLRSETQDLERQADRLNRRLNAQPKGTGFCEAIATLEAEVKGLKLDNARLADDAKGAHNQVRAKDKQLDHMAAQVEEARRVLIQNGELENYILDLRRQLQEAASERATLLSVQRQNRSDIAMLTEERDAAKAEANRTARELTLCTAQLKVFAEPLPVRTHQVVRARAVAAVQAREENAVELAREAELRKAELTRVMAVASRAVHREASSIKEDGTVPFAQHKEEVMHLKGEINRLKEKLRLEEKSAAAAQLQMRQLYSKIDALQDASGKTKQVSPRGATGNFETVMNNGPLKKTTFAGNAAQSVSPAREVAAQEAAAPQSTGLAPEAM